MEENGLKYDLLLAMGEIRDEYLREAADPSELFLFGKEAGISDAGAVWRQHQKSARTSCSGEEAGDAGAGEPDVGGKDRGASSKDGMRRRLFGLPRWSAAVAAVLCLCLIVPAVSPGAASAFRGLPLVGSIFRPVTKGAYEVRSDSKDAYVEEIEIAAAEGLEEAAQEPPAGTAGPEAAGAAGAGQGAEAAGAAGAGQGAEASGAAGAGTQTETPSVRAALSAASVTEEIRQMAQEQVSRFEESMENETGFRTLRFLHETVTDSDRWYSLGVIAYTSAADGFEQVTHFNIDKNTGERVSLASWFGSGTDYVGPLSESIKEQMRSQMQADPGVEYWIDSEEQPELDFNRISPDQDFYIDDEGRLVICFDEMTVAPSYMGSVEFTIPGEVTDQIRRSEGTGCAGWSMALQITTASDALSSGA